MAATRAVLLDVLGTLVRMAPPAPLLRGELAARGLRVEAEAAEAAFRAEIAYYVEHHLEGRDQSTLAELRNRCAAVLRDALAIPELSLADARDAMLASIRFEPYPDAAPALSALRERGLRLVAASNWDCSLTAVLDRAGLAALLDGAVSSAEAGAAKPAREPFDAALAIAGCRADEARHAGDSLANDVAGARSAGIRAVLVHRGGGAPPGVPAGVRVIGGLGELAAAVT